MNSPVATVTTKSGTPPLLDPIDAQTATVDVDFVYTVVALPTESDPVTYACTSAVSESVWLFDTNSGYFYFLPGTNQIGANVFTFTASDKDGVSSPAAMTVNVTTTPFQDWVMGQGEDPGSSNYSTNADYDGDGMNTWEEYLADTDPALSGSVLRVTGTYSTVDHQLRMVFPQSTGRYYQLQYSTNLFQGTIISNLGWGVPGPKSSQTCTTPTGLGTGASVPGWPLHKLSASPHAAKVRVRARSSPNKAFYKHRGFVRIVSLYDKSVGGDLTMKFERASGVLLHPTSLPAPMESAKSVPRPIDSPISCRPPASTCGRSCRWGPRATATARTSRPRPSRAIRCGSASTC